MTMQHDARPLRSTRRLQNLTGQRPGWYRITNSAASGPTQVAIYDEIGFYGVAAADFLADLKGINGDLVLNINSPGGDVWDGISIYNQLRQRAGNVQVIVDGLAASAASFIAMAASPGQLEIAPHAQMMIHDGFGMVIGNAADLRSTADLLDKTSDEIAGIYADRTGKPASYFRGKMQAETWYTDREAVAEGLADRIHGQDDPAPVKAEWDLSVFARVDGDGGLIDVPEPVIVNSAEAANAAGGSDDEDDAEKGDDCPTCEGTGKVMDGNRKCPDCQGTGKAKPSDEDGPSNATVFRPSDDDSDADNSPWDASKAWAAGAASDDPGAFYRGICAGRKSGDPDTQDAWALPYKYAPSGKPNAAGVRAALSRLSSTQGLTNADQAKSALEAAMKTVNPDWKPDDQIDTGLLAAAFRLGLKGA